MKTPREILLTRHQAVEPKLDALREQALSTLTEPADEKRSLVRQFIEPCRNYFHVPRLAWSGLAAGWLVIIALNVTSRDPAQKQPVALAKHNRSAETLQAVREQKRLWVELTGFGEGRDAELPRFVPRPRSERRHELMMV